MAEDVKKSLALFLLLIFFAPACGSAPKKQAQAKHPEGRSQKYYPSQDYHSIDDIIYDNLEHRRGSGVHYTAYIKQNKEFDIPYANNEYVQKWIDYFTGRGREHFERYLARLGRFMPYIHSVLDRYEVPRDIVYLSMIESGFNIRAQSWASAVGPWQFIRSTGAMYGLNVDYYIDERRDVYKSTHAAARHLRDLYNEFGDWYLAFAAYNAGAGKVRKAINLHGANFWDMAQGRYLRQETKDYVPKILAAAIISKDPQKYGFRNIRYQTAIEVETVKLKGPTDLEVAAECSGVDPDLIRLLNPELLRDLTPPHVSEYELKIPGGTKARFQKRYASLKPSERVRINYYTTRSGDSVKTIAQNYGVDPKDLAEANPGKIDVDKDRVSKKVKVSYKKGKKWRTRVKNKTYTVATYRVDPGVQLAIPKDRSLHQYSSSRDDEAAYQAEKRFGKGTKVVEKELSKKEQKRLAKLEAKRIKAEKKKQSKEGAEPVTIAKSDLEAQEAIPIRSDLEPISDLPEGPEETETELEDIDAKTADQGSPTTGTPLAFATHPDEAVANPGLNKAPSDAELRAAVKELHPVKDEPDLSGDPQAKEWVPAAKETAGNEATEAKKASPKSPAAGPSASPPAKVGTTGKTKGRIYQVKAGDTLSDIARRHHVSVGKLKKWNGDKVHPVLIAGSKIVVKETKIVKYKVKRGDNLIKIARKHDTTAEEIQQLNGLKSNLLIPGAVLIVDEK